jgi:toluene monooxygenase system ferredoxin subunit
VRPEGGWAEALPLEELWEGEMVGLRLRGADILLVNLGADGIHAYDNRCPHQGTRLSEGKLAATKLVCSAHLWEFDLRTGQGINPRSCCLRRFATRIQDGAVLVELGAG